MKYFDTKKLTNNQDGMASILITIIMMILVSLIVLGFSQVAQHEQTDSLNRQLSLQALYAAESGINDAVSVINASAGNVPAQTMCSDTSTRYTTYQNLALSNGSSGNGNIGQMYTCLLVNPTPTSLVYQPTTSQSQIAYLNSGPSITSVGSINISWQNTNYNSSNIFPCASAGSFPPIGPAPPVGWNSKCGAGVLRIDVVPANSIGESTTTTYFVYPSTTATAPNISYAPPTSGTGKILAASCPTNPQYLACSFNLQNLTGNAYYVRFSAIYTDAKVQVTGSNPFYGGETEVDSTGRISNVLRRIVAYVPPSANGIYPDYALESNQSVCKQYGYTIGPNPLYYPNTAATPGNSLSDCP
jgi:Tfp pilus assembly protein PilX